MKIDQENVGLCRITKQLEWFHSLQIKSLRETANGNFYSVGISTNYPQRNTLYIKNLELLNTF